MKTSSNLIDVFREELLIEAHELKKILDLLSSLFDIRTAFIYALSEQEYSDEIAGNNGDYQEYCRIAQQELKHKCIACDKEKFMEARKKKNHILYRCYNGLYEMFHPIFIDNLLVGYLHFGQIRGEDDFSTLIEECSLYEHSRVDLLEKEYLSMKVIERDKLMMISEIFQIISIKILRERMIELKEANPTYYLKRYIEENYNKEIDISSAAAFIGRSTSFVTHKFKNKYNMTFRAYLNMIRMEKAQELLKSHSISDTAEICGFKNRYHFSKVFKRIMHVTPHEYQLTTTEE